MQLDGAPHPQTFDAARSCLAACAMTDADGYTGLAEGMDPPQLVELVNRYFGELFAAVLANHGVVVDVKGDGILAVWTSEGEARASAPLRPQVCAACLAILDAAERFNRSSPGRGLPTRIGVDFGPIVLANVGALERYEYRAVGDTVNTSSRLEELNKLLGTRLLVSEPLAEGVDGFLFRDIGPFVLRGKRSPLRVLELVAERARASREQVLLCRRFAIARETYEAGRIEAARREFGALRAAYPHDGATRFFLQRCFSADAPARAARRCH
jgi:adenylate cyclase